LKTELGADAPATFICEGYEKVSLLADKWRLYEVALKLGIPTPRTVLPAGGDLDEVFALGLPIVAKPRLAEASLGVRFLDSPEEVERIVHNAPRIGVDLNGEYPYIFQEYIAGPIHNVGGCLHDGRPVSLMTWRNVLCRYEFGGPGIVHMTTSVSALVAYATHIFAHVGWSGPAQMNFIEARGRYFLIDFNPRIWGSTELAVAAGVNVCQQAVDVMAFGRRVKPTDGYRVGLVSKWLTAGSFARCFRRPRSPRAIAFRLWSLLDPRRPTVTNLRAGNVRHLSAMVLDNAVRRRDRRRGS
jgi:predicted ATP-grasp superfamily ATP-dependent carboligase